MHFAYTKFDINTFIRVLRKFETDWIMFEEKPKPATPTEEAEANMATKKKKTPARYRN